ncbi:MAG TPA: hypothetical protein VK141_01080 [Nitrosomonas sp.]|nr:hypothetical protein [Nitrosomonas sp.]
MKPEMRIALLKEVANAQDSITDSSVSGRTKYGYLGATFSSLCGITALANAIPSIAENGGSLALHVAFLSASFIVIGCPWYFIIRKEMNRKIQLICEAILNIDDSGNNAQRDGNTSIRK